MIIKFGMMALGALLTAGVAQGSDLANETFYDVVSANLELADWTESELQLVNAGDTITNTHDLNVLDENDLLVLGSGEYEFGVDTIESATLAVNFQDASTLGFFGFEVELQSDQLNGSDPFSLDITLAGGTSEYLNVDAIGQINDTGMLEITLLRTATGNAIKFNNSDLVAFEKVDAPLPSAALPLIVSILGLAAVRRRA